MHFEIGDPAVYRAALYIRLSKEDDNGAAESQSVTNQRSLLSGFAQAHRLRVYDTYIDDGISGTTFERPDFNRMVLDIEKKQVNMVVVKDLSRLGRDYIQTGYYMERYFPEHHVRFISLLDGIDTGQDSTANDLTPFRAIMNDMYAKDISKKIRSVKHDKQRKGLFIGGKAVYGYKLSDGEKNKIVIDEEAAAIVKRVFTLAAGGMSCRQIAQCLNEERIPTPAAYAGLAIEQRGKRSGLWSSERISEMLQNPMYIGNMAQGKTRRISYKTKKSVRIDKQHWKIVENTHEPIIGRDVFDKVAKLVASRNSTRTRTYDYLLKGIIRCHECGYPLAVVNRPNAKGEKTLYFICRTYQRFAKGRACTCHSAKVEDITRVVLERLRYMIDTHLDAGRLEAVAASALDDAEDKDDRTAQTVRLKNRIETLTAAIDRTYMDKLFGTLDEQDFRRVYWRLKEERASLESKLLQRESGQQTPEGKKQLARQFVGRFMNMGCSRQLVVSLIERVEMTEDRKLLVYFRFREPVVEDHLQ